MTSICYLATNITILTIFVASRLAPALINSWTTSTWPAELATIKAVSPSWFLVCVCVCVCVSRLAPALIISWTTWTWPAEIATVYVSWASTFFARRSLPTYPTYSVHVYVCIFIIHSKHKLCTYIHVCAPRVQYIVVKVGCRGIYIAHAN